MRQIALLLIPAAAAIARARDADHRGSSTSAASSTPSRPSWSPRRCSGSRFSLPFAGCNLLLTRTFFTLQQPVDRRPRSRGVIAGRQRRSCRSRSTSRRDRAASCSAPPSASAAMTVAARRTACARELGGLRDRPHAAARSAMMLVAARAARRSSPTASGTALDDALGRSLLAQIVSVGARARRSAARSTPRSCSRCGIPEAQPDRRARPRAGCGRGAS